MPELPEVETVRRQLVPFVAGRRLERLEVLDDLWCRPLAAGEIAEAVEGRVVERLSRRGKYLTWEMEGDVFLITHLRMTGTFLYDAAPDTRHPRVRFVLGDGHEVLFADQRRFGTGELAVGPAARDAFFAARLGIEPLGPELTTDALRVLARGRRAPIKAFLLDQRRVAGVGNIYADEALFRARVHPLRPAGSLTRRQWEALRDAIVEVLQAGIDARGATIDDFRHADGAYGSFQDRFLVHLRRGEPCPVCETPIVKMVAAGRGTYVCERCQRKPRTRRRAG